MGNYVYKSIRSDKGQMLAAAAFQICHGGNSIFINSLDETKFLCFTFPLT